MAFLFALLTLFSLYEGIKEAQSINSITQYAEKLSFEEISKRMSQGSNNLNVELIDGKIDCTSLSYLETTYAFVIKEYTAYILITSNDNSIVLYSFYKGTPSCEEIGTMPVRGIVMKMEEAARAGMYKTNLLGIRKYPDALLFRFCGGCTKESQNTKIYIMFGFSAFTFLGFLFSLYYQWRKWSEEEKVKSNQ
jgi:hypothetical protein